MVRGKIQIKRIDNATSRQVTFSKRRKGLFKKADELSIVCDSQVSVLILSGSGKLYEHISGSTTTKQVMDLYQTTLGVDVWRSNYEKMQDYLKKLKEKNRSLRRQIRQRMGEDLSDLSFEELHTLEEEMDTAVRVVRERKFKVLSTQISTTNKKYQQAVQVNRVLTDGIKQDESEYGLVGSGEDFDTTFSDGIHAIFGLGTQPNQLNQSESVLTTSSGNLRTAKL